MVCAGDIQRQGPNRVDASRPWSSLFGVITSGKSSFTKVHNISNPEKGIFAIEFSDPVIDHNIALMALTRVSKFLGPRPNIGIVRIYARKKWALKGHVEITVMLKGALSLTFSYEEDMTKILCGGP